MCKGLFNVARTKKTEEKTTTKQFIVNSFVAGLLERPEHIKPFINLGYGDVLIVTGIKNGYYAVTTEDGNNGYIESYYVKEK